ncbi:amino acid adenylation domain-containing protein [Streptomyces monticola]|uniref:Amino acid adenylation domain-containing protein n=1 Tax=Streptomyces monticola TaxID=2666263 RepID=A0ABW2JXP4_9ACTN
MSRTEHGVPAARQTALTARFEAQAAATPTAVAVETDGATVTYAELNARANRIAHRLIARGTGPEDIVAVAVDASPDLVSSLLGIWKAGALYLPLDPGYPAERLAYMAADAAPRCLLTTRAVDTALGALAPHTERLYVDEAPTGTPRESGDTDRVGTPREADDTNPVGRHTGHDQGVYVIYTSGSTGRPKGVVVTHGALSNFLDCMSDRYPLGPGDTVVSTTPVSFDIAGLELYLPLLNGARLHLVPRHVTVDGNRLRRRLAEVRPTLMQGTPALWQLLREAGWRPDELPRGAHLLTGGEALPQDLAGFLADSGHADVWNLYGPTETTIWSTLAPVRPHEPVTIGGPLWHTGAHVLDERLREVPDGTAGELHLSGAGLARGYLGRAALTAERFVACPYGPPGSRMYRTGDVVRRGADGTLEFLGRTDEQVKVRGHRIELGEIEEALRARAEVAQARVVVREDTPGAPHLAGYVVPAPGASPQPAALRAALARWLPDHMVPAGVAVLDRFPLTPAGKVDRKALPPLAATRSPARRAAATPEEHTLVGLFRDILRIEDIGADDGFFELGGNSLLATRLIARVRDELGRELTVRTVFDEPSPAALARVLASGATAPARRAPGPMERTGPVPLSYAQQRLWFLDRLEGPSTTYNLPIAVRLTGGLDLDALRSAVESLVHRHESLRTRFREGPGGAVQDIVPADRAEVPLVVRDVPADALDTAIDRAARHVFDLADDIPFRAELLRTGATEGVLLLCIHHIASDGWSLAPLVRDLCTAYAAAHDGTADGAAPLPMNYADYTLWQRELLGAPDDPGSELSRQLTYWRETLAGAPERLDLPTDRPRPARASYRGDVIRFDVDAALTDRLLDLAGQRQVSLFMVVQAAVATLLTRLGCGSDIPLGSPIAGRADRALDDLVGFFVNTLVLRTDTSGNPAFTDLLERVKETNLAAYGHQDLPFEYLVEQLNPARSTSHHPLFQVMLVLQNNTEPHWELPGVRAVHETVPTQTAKFDLTIELTERFDAHGRPDGLRGEIEYATDLFDRDTAERIARYLRRVLDTVAADPRLPLAEIDVLDPAERYEALHHWNDTDRDLPDTAYPALFEEQAARTPDATALVCGDVSLTYAQLERRANQVAHWLIARGVGSEDIVAMALHRSPEMLPSLLGILKAGAGYLPLDPTYPPDRLAFMVADTTPKTLLTTGDVAAALPEEARALPRLEWDDPHAVRELDTAPTHPPTDADRLRPLRLDDLAYVIYTSGSTGRPKGVAVTHRGIPNLARSYIERFGLDADARFLQFSSINFDPTFCEMCCTLLSGATVMLTSPEELLSVDRQRALLARHRPTHMTFSPTILGSMDRAALADCRNLMVAGEACPPGLAATWSQGHRFINAYGPTEATVDALYWEYGSGGPGVETDSVPVGRPLHNTRVYLLDERLRPVPPGVTGELYLAGHGLARGYLGRPALTAERFVACPFGPPGGRMYRTGDLARRRPHSGVIDFVGRTDEQVKIRGMRIEPGEIEAVLDSHPDVVQSAVVVREDTPDHKQLVGYVVARAADPATRDPHDEADHVDRWQLIHEQGYSEQEGLATQEDFTGWNSSYDNRPIPLDQMREWRAATVERIRALRPQHVLEVGVGSGLILWEVAPHCSSYTGLDFSPSVIQALGARVAESPELRDRVRLRALPAHELGLVDRRRYDTVVINSVAQYFPSGHYLVDVLRQALDLLVPGGRVYLGDIRDLRLLRTFATAIVLGNDAHAQEPAAALRERITQAVDLESELLVDPAFFTLLAEQTDTVAGVDIQLKRAAHRNELTDFRYEVVLHKHGGSAPVSAREGTELTWSDGLSGLDEIREHLDRKRPATLRVRALPNWRVSAEARAERHLWNAPAAAAPPAPDGQHPETGPAERTATGRADRPATGHDERPGIDPEALHALAADLGYTVKPTVCDGAPDRFDAVFFDATHTEVTAFTDLFDPAPDGRPLHERTNTPHADDHTRKLGQALRRHAGKELPDHMVPAAIVVLDQLPLTPNGKLDTRQLPPPDFSARTVRPPRTPDERLLARLFAEVLGLDEAGADDRFFDLGGDSIRSIQLVSRARAEGLTLTARDVFQHQTVEALAALDHTGTGPGDPAADEAAELAHWHKTLQTPDPPFTPAGPAPGRAALTRALPPELAEAVREVLPRLFHAGPEHIALAALAPALGEWRRHREPRTPAALRLDLTTGGYDEAFPVRLSHGLTGPLDQHLGEPRTLARTVKRIKEQLRAVPAHGANYPQLRASRDGEDFTAAQICFRHTATAATDATAATAATAAPAPPAGTSPYALSVDMRPDAVETTWQWDTALFTEDEIAALAERFVTVVGALATLAGHPGLGGLTPSDIALVPLKQSTISELERSQPGLLDIWPLAPLQQGLLLHARATQGQGDPYQGQSLFTLDGPLDAERLRSAAQALLDRHGNLRAGFLSEGLETPVQAVRQHVEVPWRLHDLSGLPAAEQERRRDRIIADDAALPFDLAEPPMLRFILLRFADDHHELLVADHHILLDGWSMPTVWEELFALYDGARLPVATAFRDYLGWLGAQDREAAADVWRRYLAGVTEPTRLAPGELVHALPRTTGLVLSASLTRALTEVCGRVGVTLNTALQTAWGIQLSRLTGRRDVVFGVTVSERPAEIPGIENAVGLLINTVPLRVRVDPAEPPAAALTRVQTSQLDTFGHRHLGLTDIQRLLGLGELFDTYYVFQNMPDEPDGGLRTATGLRMTEQTQSAKGVSHYPLGITVIPGERLEILFGHHPDLFDTARIEELKQSLTDIIEALVGGPSS